MNKLTAVNEILTALGEHPVSSVELKNPTISIILRAISQECRAVQLRAWWFNSYQTTLYAGDDGIIQAPDNAVNWTWIDRPSHIAAGYIQDTVNMTSDWRISGVGSVTGTVVLEMDYESLPPVVREWVVKRALISAYVNDFGLEDIVGEYQRQAAYAEQMVFDSHLQFKKYSTAKSARFQRIKNHIRR